MWQMIFYVFFTFKKYKKGKKWKYHKMTHVILKVLTFIKWKIQIKTF